MTVNSTTTRAAPSARSGRPIEGVELRIADDEGEPVEEGRIGEVADPQPGDDAGLRRCRRAQRRGVPGRLVPLTGDRGRVDEEGRLFLTGRTKRLIDVEGDKVDPVEVEDVLAVHPKVGEVVVVGVESDIPGEELVKAVVVPAGDCRSAS